MFVECEPRDEMYHSSTLLQQILDCLNALQQHSMKAQQLRVQMASLTLGSRLCANVQAPPSAIPGHTKAALVKLVSLGWYTGPSAAT